LAGLWAEMGRGAMEHWGKTKWAGIRLEGPGTAWLQVVSRQDQAKKSGKVMTQKDITQPGPLLAGKRGLVMGVANERSIAWGIARTCAQHGAKLAFTYQGEQFGRRAVPLAESVGSDVIVSCDVADLASVDAAFAEIESKWGGLDFIVHALAFSDRRELQGRYSETSRENFTNTMVISCFSFTEVAKRAAALMKNGGSMLTLTYGGSQRVVPSYNVMGVAKAALEASVRYLAADLGPDGIRVNAISAGPIRTLSAGGIAGFRKLYGPFDQLAPLRSHITIEDCGKTALYLASDLSSAVTGEVIYVDGGFNILGVPSAAD